MLREKIVTEVFIDLSRSVCVSFSSLLNLLVIFPCSLVRQLHYVDVIQSVKHFASLIKVSTFLYLLLIDYSAAARHTFAPAFTCVPLVLAYRKTGPKCVIEADWAGHFVSLEAFSAAGSAHSVDFFEVWVDVVMGSHGLVLVVIHDLPLATLTQRHMKNSNLICL